ncbi:MAG TPA: DNA sulfur modification protein DndB, partial [Trichocoleus sp.]
MAPTTRATARRTQKTESSLAPAHFYTFPAIRGIQAGREFYTGMIPIRLLSKLFAFDSEDVPPELRAQRILNEARARKIKDYLVENRSSYVFNSVTVMLDIPGLGSMEFQPASENTDFGSLKVDMQSKFLICDGQHRVRGCIKAFEDDPDLGDESLPVVFFLYTTLERAQQVFSDLNSHGSKPNSSINLLYNHRDKKADVTRDIIEGVEVLKRYTDMERTSVAAKSSKLFTLNGIDAANQALFSTTFIPFEEQVRVGIRFWEAVFTHMKDWQDVFERRVAASDIRQNTVSGHAITLIAIGHFGNMFIKSLQTNWIDETSYLIEALSVIDWNRNNPDWQGLIIFNDKIDKSKQTCVNLGQYIHSHIAKIKHPVPDLSKVDTSSEKFQAIKTWIKDKLAERGYGVSFRDTHEDMPWEYKALLDLENEGYCKKFAD